MIFPFQRNWLWFSISVFQIIFVIFVSTALGADSLNIPVRLSVMGGYNGISTSFGDERSGDYLGGVGAGADFNVPIKGTKSMVGITGWLGALNGSGKTIYGNSFVFGAYYGYTVGRFDLFLGPAVSAAQTTLEDTEAGTNKSIKYSSTMGCGMAGVRYYPFGAKKITGGVSLSSFYCGSGSYKKTTRSMTNTETEDSVSESATSVGALISLFVGWDDQRKIY